MASGLKNNGEVQILEDAMGNTQYEIGLYNDSADALGDDATVSDISSEPATADDYSRQTVSGFNVSLNANSNGEAVAPQVTFNVSSNTESVDAVFVVNTSTGELQFTSALQQSRDLSSIDNLVNNNTGIILD